jgi:hypothetical protein
MQRTAADIVRALILVLLVSLASCGYGLTHSGGIVPEGAKNIAIPTFINDTNEPYVDVEVTKAAANEFVHDGRLNVVGPESADLILRGKVAKFEMIPQSYDVNSYVQQYYISIVVDISIEDVKTHKIILQEKGLNSVFVASYAVSIGDITSTKIAKQAAIIQASQDVASTLRSRVLEGF